MSVHRNRESIEAFADGAAEKITGTRDDVERERARATKDQESALRLRTVRGLQAKADDLASTVAAAGETVDREITRATLNATNYASTSAPRDLAATISEANLLVEIKTGGCVDLLRRIEARASIEDFVELDRLLRVAGPFIVETTRTPRAKIAQRLGANTLPDRAEKEEGAAWRLFQISEARNGDLFPPEIQIATELRGRVLLPLFTMTVGASAWSMSEPAFRAIMNGSAAPPSRWAVDPLWFARELEGAPRWSPAR
jgi:hypothetical protein